MLMTGKPIDRREQLPQAASLATAAAPRISLASAEGTAKFILRVTEVENRSRYDVYAAFRTFQTSAETASQEAVAATRTIQ